MYGSWSDAALVLTGLEVDTTEYGMPKCRITMRLDNNHMIVPAYEPETLAVITTLGEQIEEASNGSGKIFMSPFKAKDVSLIWKQS
jgi:hypothetical protein